MQHSTTFIGDADPILRTRGTVFAVDFAASHSEFRSEEFLTDVRNSAKRQTFKKGPFLLIADHCLTLFDLLHAPDSIQV